ncbi:unnamed protein product [Auanema sp. JU1783]|nr:unnamed protein product [Auanema sp. JU1783]
MKLILGVDVFEQLGIKILVESENLCEKAKRLEPIVVCSIGSEIVDEYKEGSLVVEYFTLTEFFPPSKKAEKN